MKDKIRPLYDELQGYLSDLPNLTANYMEVGCSQTIISEQVNSAINLLEEITGSVSNTKDSDHLRLKIVMGMTPLEFYL